MTILMKDIMPDINVADFKIHLAKKENGNEPLDAFLNGDWIEWQVKKKVNRFNEKYIMTFAKIYTRDNDFLFTGIYEVCGDDPDDAKKYKIKDTNIYQKYSGRVIVKIYNNKQIYKGRATALKAINFFDSIEVIEILEKRIEETDFPGFDCINISFKDFKNIIKRGSGIWRTPLCNVEGVYLLTDTKTNKHYIGSATGEGGIWGRWSQYIDNYHGGNKKLKELLKNENSEYFLNNFKFSLIDNYTKGSVSKEIILKRESYWKEVLLTRKEKFGYNDN